MKRLLLIWAINIALYIIIYSIRSFVIWEISNPFKWLIDLPIYTNSRRGEILIGLALLYTLELFMVYSTLDKDLKVKKEIKKKEY